ncbi:UNVERIFIED_CONTAM: ubiquitin carboxyl-terminal hydrolase [Hammondia hammondi]|eukprot:XP_008889500.1 ubiquitin carboxyl-terminal hydrolase [Hammondia hammondi]
MDEPGDSVLQQDAAAFALSAFARCDQTATDREPSLAASMLQGSPQKAGVDTSKRWESGNPLASSSSVTPSLCPVDQSSKTSKWTGSSRGDDRVERSVQASAWIPCSEKSEAAGAAHAGSHSRHSPTSSVSFTSPPAAVAPPSKACAASAFSGLCLQPDGSTPESRRIAQSAFPKVSLLQEGIPAASVKLAELGTCRTDHPHSLVAPEAAPQHQASSVELDVSERLHPEAHIQANVISVSHASASGSLPPLPSVAFFLHRAASACALASHASSPDDGSAARLSVKAICGPEKPDARQTVSSQHEQFPSVSSTLSVSNSGALSPRRSGGSTTFGQTGTFISPPTACSSRLPPRPGRQEGQLAGAKGELPEMEVGFGGETKTERERESERGTGRELGFGDKPIEMTEEGWRLERGDVEERDSGVESDLSGNARQKGEKTAAVAADVHPMQTDTAPLFGGGTRQLHQEGHRGLLSGECPAGLLWPRGQLSLPVTASRTALASSPHQEQRPGEARDEKPRKDGTLQPTSREGFSQTAQDSEQLSPVHVVPSSLAEQCCLGDLLFMYNLRHSFAVPRESQQDAHPMSVFGLGEFKTGVWGKGGQGGPGGGAGGACGPGASGSGKKKNENAYSLQRELQQQQMAVRWLLTVTGNGSSQTSATVVPPRRNRLARVSKALGAVSAKHEPAGQAASALSSSSFSSASAVTSASGLPGDQRGQEACESPMKVERAAYEDSVGVPSFSSHGRTGWEQKSEQAAILGATGLRKCRYVGLENLGATCYLNVYLQTLFMNVHFRDFLLSLPTLRELEELERQRPAEATSPSLAPSIPETHSQALVRHPNEGRTRQYSRRADDKKLQTEESDQSGSRDAETADGEFPEIPEPRCKVEVRETHVKQDAEERGRPQVKEERLTESAGGCTKETALVPTENPPVAEGHDAARPSAPSSVPQPFDPVFSASSPACLTHGGGRAEAEDQGSQADSRARWCNWREKVKGQDVCTVLCSQRYSLISSLQTIFAKLQEGIQAAVRPSVVADLLAEDLSYQEDANELQHRLFELLESELGGRESPLDFLRVLFGGRSRQTVKCSHCTYSGNKEEYFFQLNCCHKKSHQSGKHEPGDRNSRISPEQTEASRSPSLPLSPSPFSPERDLASQEADESRATTSPKSVAASTSPRCGPGPLSSLPASQWESLSSSQEDSTCAPASVPVDTDLAAVSNSRPEQSESKRRGRRGKRGPQRGAAASAHTGAGGQQGGTQGTAGGRRQEGRESCERKGDVNSTSARGPGRKSVSAGQGRRPVDENKGGWKLEEDMARQYQRTENLRGDSEYFCPQCGEKREAKKRSQLSLLPPYLQLVVLRYNIDVKKQTGEWVRRKIHEALEIPLVMDVRGCCTDDCQIGHLDGTVSSLRDASHAAHQYHLFGILEHQGASATSGHYVAITRDLRERGAGRSACADAASVDDFKKTFLPSSLSDGSASASLSQTTEAASPLSPQDNGDRFQGCGSVGGWREAAPLGEGTLPTQVGLSGSEFLGSPRVCPGRGGEGGAQRGKARATSAEGERRSDEDCRRSNADLMRCAGGSEGKDACGKEAEAPSRSVDSSQQAPGKLVLAKGFEGDDGRFVAVTSSIVEPVLSSPSVSPPHRGTSASRKKGSLQEGCGSPSFLESTKGPPGVVTAAELVGDGGAIRSPITRDRDAFVFRNPSSFASPRPRWFGPLNGPNETAPEPNSVTVVVDVDASSPSLTVSAGSSSCCSGLAAPPHHSLTPRLCSFPHPSTSVEKTVDKDDLRSGVAAAADACPAETSSVPGPGALSNPPTRASPSSILSCDLNSSPVDSSTSPSLKPYDGAWETTNEDACLEVCEEPFRTQTPQAKKSRGRSKVEALDVSSLSPTTVTQKDLFSLELKSPRSRHAFLGRLSSWMATPEPNAAEAGESGRGDRKRIEGLETQKGSCCPKKQGNASLTQRTLDQYVGRTRAQVRSRDTGCVARKGGSSPFVSNASLPRRASSSPGGVAACWTRESPDKKRRKQEAERGREEQMKRKADQLQRRAGRDQTQAGGGRQNRTGGKKEKQGGENCVSLVVVETPEEEDDETDVEEEFVILASPLQHEAPRQSVHESRHENGSSQVAEMDEFCQGTEPQMKTALDKLTARSAAVDEDLEEIPEVILDAGLPAEKKQAFGVQPDTGDNADKERSNSDVVETKAAPQTPATRWSWVRFDDSEVCPFPLPRPSSSGLDSSAPRSSSEGSPRHRTPPRGCVVSSFAAASGASASSSLSCSLLAEEEEWRRATPEAERVGATSRAPVGRSSSAGSLRIYSRTVYMVTYIRADLTAEETDMPLPRELQDFIDEENERICEEQETLCMRQQTLLAYVQQRQAALQQLLRHALPSALKELEQQRQERVQKEALHGEMARARLPSPVCERNLVNIQQRLSLLPQLRQLSFIPRSWWQQFVRGIDYPTMSSALPPSLLPRRDSNNRNGICMVPLTKAENGVGKRSARKRKKNNAGQRGASGGDREKIEDEPREGGRLGASGEEHATAGNSELEGSANAGAKKEAKTEDLRGLSIGEVLEGETREGRQQSSSAMKSEETARSEHRQQGLQTSGGGRDAYSRAANAQGEGKLYRQLVQSYADGGTTSEETREGRDGDAIELACRSESDKEKGVIDYSSILCPHYRNALAASTSCSPAAAKTVVSPQGAPVTSSLSMPALSSNASSLHEAHRPRVFNSSGSDEEKLLAEPSYPIEKLLRVTDICGERGVDPLSIWTGEAKAIPTALFSDLLAASSLRPSIPDPSLLPNLCSVCSAALSGLVDFYSEQHRSIEAILEALKRQKTIPTVCEEKPASPELVESSHACTLPSPRAILSSAPKEVTLSSTANGEADRAEGVHLNFVQTVDAGGDGDTSPVRSESSQETEKNSEETMQAEALSSIVAALPSPDDVHLPSSSQEASASPVAPGDQQQGGEKKETQGGRLISCVSSPCGVVALSPIVCVDVDAVPDSLNVAPLQDAEGNRQTSVSSSQSSVEGDGLDSGENKRLEAEGPLSPRILNDHETPARDLLGCCIPYASLSSSPRAAIPALNPWVLEHAATLPEFIYVSRRPLQRAFSLHSCFLTLCTLPTASSPASVPFSALLPSSSSSQSRELKVLRAKMKREGKDSREKYLSWLTLSDVRREVTLGRKLAQGDSDPSRGVKPPKKDTRKDGDWERAEEGIEEGEASNGEGANDGRRKRRKTVEDEEQGEGQVGGDEDVEEIDMDDEGEESASLGSLSHAEGDGKTTKKTRVARTRKAVSPPSGAKQKAAAHTPHRATSWPRSDHKQEENEDLEEEEGNTEAGQGISRDAHTGRDNVFDFASDLLCCHQKLRIQGAVGKSNKLQRFLVPTAAILNFLYFEREKNVLYRELGIANPVTFACSTFVSQYAQECSICLTEQQAEQQRRQVWRDKRNEESKALGQIIGKRWRLRKETGSASRLATPLPKKGRFFFVSTEWRHQWLSYVASGSETEGVTSKPPPLLNSSLLCDCPTRGLKIDPTDTLLSPTFLADPPESETDTYILVHEDDIDLLERFGLTGFKTAENLSMCVEVKHIPGEIASSLLPPSSSPSSRLAASPCFAGPVPAFFFPSLAPCSACVRAHRIEQGFYDFPPVDLSFHLRQNRWNGDAPEAKSGPEFVREAGPGRGRSHTGNGGRRQASSRVPGQKKITVRVSGETEIASLLAHVIASMTEAEETKETTVYLEGPPRHVFYFSPKSSCLSVSIPDAGPTASPPNRSVYPSTSPTTTDTLPCTALNLLCNAASARAPPAAPCSSSGRWEEGKDTQLLGDLCDGQAVTRPLCLPPSGARQKEYHENREACDVLCLEPTETATMESEGDSRREHESQSQAEISTLPLVSSVDEEVGKEVKAETSGARLRLHEETYTGKEHRGITLRAVSLPHSCCLSLEVEMKTHLRDLLLYVNEAWQVAYEFQESRQVDEGRREKAVRKEAEAATEVEEALVSVDLQEAGFLEAEEGTRRRQDDSEAAERVLEIQDSEKEDDGGSAGEVSQVQECVEVQDASRGAEKQTRMQLSPLPGDSLVRNKRERSEEPEPFDVLTDCEEQEELAQSDQKKSRSAATHPTSKALCSLLGGDGKCDKGTENRRKTGGRNLPTRRSDNSTRESVLRRPQDTRAGRNQRGNRQHASLLEDAGPKTGVSGQPDTTVCYINRHLHSSTGKLRQDHTPTETIVLLDDDEEDRAAPSR